jgi:cytosine deaminase
MEQAMDLGADVVGGLPWYERLDRDMHEHIDFCFELAKRTGKDIHMLADDTDNPNSRSLEYLAVRAIEEGYEGRVTASHCGALAAYDDNHAEKVIAIVKEADMTIASNTQISLVLDGRGDRGLVRRGITRVRELLDAGVNVISAQDDVNDPYYPFGKPDQLEVAQYTAHVAQLTYPPELETVFDMVAVNAARAMRLEGYGVEPGSRADLVLIDAPTVHEALRLLPPRRYVFYGGRLLAESRLDSTLHVRPGAAGAAR